MILVMGGLCRGCGARVTLVIVDETSVMVGANAGGDPVVHRCPPQRAVIDVVNELLDELRP